MQTIKRNFIFILVIYAFLSCNNFQNKIQEKEVNTPEMEMVDERIVKTPLEKRGWGYKKRTFFMDRQGHLYEDYMVKLFIDKKITMGMPKQLIAFLYGQPNKTSDDSDLIWYYLDENYKTLLKIEFNYEDKVINYNPTYF